MLSISSSKFLKVYKVLICSDSVFCKDFNPQKTMVIPQEFLPPCEKLTDL